MTPLRPGVLPLLLFAASVSAQPLLDAPMVWTDTRYYATAGDVDGDGDLDLLGWEYDPAILGYRAALYGHESSLRFPRVNTGVIPNATQETRFGDINGDGIGDVVVRTIDFPPFLPQILVLPGLGGGQFGAPIASPIGPGLTNTNGPLVAVDDANGDGRDDVLLVGIRGSNLEAEWFLSAAPGSLAVTPSGSVVLASANYTTYALFDQNGDGDLDIAVAESSTSLIRIFDTNGGLLTQLPSGPSLPPFGSGEGLAAGDFDGDGLGDVVVRRDTNGYGAVALDVALRRSNSWLYVATPFTVTAPNSRPLVGDFDGDGDDDLLVGGSRFFASQGNGSFLPARRLDAAPGAPVFIADLDANGTDDLVFSNAVQLTGQGSLDSGFGTSPTEVLASLDADRDGDIDLVTSPFTWFTNTGASWLPVSASNPPTVPPAPATHPWNHGSWIADLDADGDLDAVEVFRSSNSLFPMATLVTRILERTGPTTVMQAGPIIAGALPLGNSSVFAPVTRPFLQPVDFNGDGAPDLMGADSPWLNAGALTFAPMTPALYPGMVPLAAGDVDGDLDQDLLVAPASPPSSLYLLQNAGSSSTLSLLSAGSGTSNPQRPSAILADFDADGDLDVAASWNSASLSSPSIIEIRERIGAAWATQVLTLGTAGPGQLAAADVNADGRLDLLANAAAPASRVHVWIQSNGPGLSFEPVRVFAGAFLDIFDAEGDGDPDLISFGTTLIRGRRFEGPPAGQRRQFGNGTAGGGGYVPVLGVSGILRSGESGLITLASASGATSGILIIGPEVNLPNFLVPGVTTLVYPFDVVIPFVTSGTPNQFGVGNWSLPFTLPSGLLGARLSLQVALADAASPTFGISASNGVTLDFGL